MTNYIDGKQTKKLKIAIVHDWLIGGGAEKVVEALHNMYPEAPIYTSFATDKWRNKLNNKVITGYLQHWPFSSLRKYIPFLRIWWFESLDLSKYDLVISSSGAEAKGVKTTGKTIHVNYCHAPTHYYWSRYDEYLKNPGFGIFDFFARLGLRLFVKPLRKWDYKAAQRPDKIIANSTYTKAQIKKYYNRESAVVFPPIETAKFKPKNNQKRAGFVIAGRQTPYKRFDIAIKACVQLNLPLLVIGDGPSHSKLLKLAESNITFKTKATDKDLIEAFHKSEGFLFPGVDDFGIVAVEALASGCPVIAYKNGGALDYIKPSLTGLFFEEPTPESLAKTLQIFKKTSFSESQIIKSAESFNTQNFVLQIKEEINKII